MKQTQFDAKNFYPPCRVACPVKTDIRSYLSEIAQGNYEEAYKFITENNPFPSVCGRICMHPCESACRRNEADMPLAIKDLKRFASEYVNKKGLFLGKKSKIKTGKKVAIIGAGPSGLTAAADLAKAGHKVVVYEKNKKPGGMLYYGIPKYRLPEKELNEDIKRITNLGVTIKTGSQIGLPAGRHGKTITFPKLKKDYDAVLISVGLSNSRSLPIEGCRCKNVYLALDFLKSVNSSKKPFLGKNIMVIGGGNVAMDVARTAKRLNAKAKVTMACLESFEEMPASKEEIKEAQEEGIKIENCKGPRRINLNKGEAKSVDFITCASVFDTQGRFNPKFKEKEKHHFSCDTVIIAIGQASDLSFTEETGVDLNERGQLMLSGQETTARGVFASGEVAKGPGAAIAAIANGHEAASKIHEFLIGKPFTKEEDFVEVGRLPKRMTKLIKLKDRQEMPMLAAKERLNLKPFELGYNEKQAQKEASRCMNCGSGAFVMDSKCASCLTCVRVCPFEIPKIIDGRVAFIDSDECQACGICSAECPATAINVKAFTIEAINRQIEEAFQTKKKSTGIVNFTCQYHREVSPDEAVHVGVLCIGRLDPINLLKPFELGAEGVIANCYHHCRFKNKSGPNYVKRRIILIKKMLDELGIGQKRITFVEEALDKKTLKNFIKEINSVSSHPGRAKASEGSRK